MQILASRGFPALWIVCVVAVTAFALVRGHRSTTDLPVCKKPASQSWCDPNSCGTNSPVVNGFPLNGLRPDGECNDEGVQLVPGSLRGGVRGSCAGATIDLERNTLVGRDRDGVLRCAGDDVVGASFEVRSWTRQTARIRIAGLRDHVQGNDPVNQEVRKVYQLVRDDAAPGAPALCDRAGAAALRTSLGLTPVSGGDPAGPALGRDLVFPIDSEMYDVLGQPIAIKHSWRLARREWMNLACQGSALAERSLHRLSTDNVDRSRAALKMLTANYCGTRQLTVSGVMLGWDFGSPDFVEAHWSASGATCLSKPRLLYRGLGGPAANFASLPEALRKICDGQVCPTVDAWLAAARTCRRGSQGWTLPECPERCTGSGCASELITSFVMPPPS
jgi:hypothetical protein